MDYAIQKEGLATEGLPSDIRDIMIDVKRYIDGNGFKSFRRLITRLLSHDMVVPKDQAKVIAYSQSGSFKESIPPSFEKITINTEAFLRGFPFSALTKIVKQLIVCRSVNFSNNYEVVVFIVKLMNERKYDLEDRIVTLLSTDQFFRPSDLANLTNASETSVMEFLDQNSEKVRQTLHADKDGNRYYTLFSNPVSVRELVATVRQVMGLAILS